MLSEVLPVRAALAAPLGDALVLVLYGRGSKAGAPPSNSPRALLSVLGAAAACGAPLALRCVKGMRVAAPDAGADAYGSAGAVRARRHRARPRRRVRVGALRSREPE